MICFLCSLCPVFWKLINCFAKKTVRLVSNLTPSRFNQTTKYALFQQGIIVLCLNWFMTLAPGLSKVCELVQDEESDELCPSKAKNRVFHLIEP